MAVLQLFLLLTASSGSAGCIGDQLAQHEYLVKNNKFVVYRTLLEYRHNLGRVFYDELFSLPKNAHWVDAGAGRALVFDRLPADVLCENLTAIGVAKPEDALGIVPGRNYRYLEGYLEHIPAARIGPAHLITDLWGPFVYSVQPDLIVKKYLDVLQKGRSAIILLDTDMITIDGGPRGLKNWLNAIEGAEVIWAKDNSHLRGISSVIRIHKVGDRVSVPTLYRDEFIAGDIDTPRTIHGHKIISPLPYRVYHR